MTQILLQAISALKKGELILIVADFAPKVQCYFVAAASSIDSSDISIMANQGGGVVMAGVSEERIAELHLPPMAPHRKSGLDLTVSVEARQGVTTGISAADRAKTLRTIAKTNNSRYDLVTPGHIFPIRAKKGGVLVRTSIAEASVDLMQMAELSEVTAVCQCLDKNGELLDEAGIADLSSRNSLPLLSISDIVRYRLASESIVEKVAEAKMPTKIAGEFEAVCFKSVNDGAEHLVLIKGDLSEKDSNGKQKPVLTRVQAENQIGDLLRNESIESNKKIAAALRAIDKEKRGVLVYVRHPRRGMLKQQVDALAKGKTVVNPGVHVQEYGIGSQILSAIGAKRITLLSHSSVDISGIKAYQIEIVGHKRFDVN